MKSWVLIVLVLVLACAGLGQPAFTPPYDPHAPWGALSESEKFPNPNKFVIYQLLVRTFANTKDTNVTFGTREVNGVGTFNAITEKALQGIKELGVTHVWYTGILRHATMDDYTAYGIPLDDSDVVKGRAGSPYAIVDYYDVAPSLADSVPNRMREFEALVRRTHAQGLKVLIDFVPNHVARGYRSLAKPRGVRDFGQDDDPTQAFSVKNNFYYRPGEPFIVPRYNPLGPAITAPMEDGHFEENPAKVTGNDVNRANPSVNDWFETVKLNFGVDMFTGPRQTFFDPPPSTWLKMRDILLFWVDKGVDGFRCDMAEMVPAEFWAWVIPQIKARKPGVLFVAEIYNPEAYARYHEAGFDVLYDKVGLYDKLRPVLSQRGLPSRVSDWWQELPVSPSIMLSFLENHDEVRLASSIFAGSPRAGIPGMALSAWIGSGPILIYAGQEVGEPGLGREGFQGEDGRTTIFDYWSIPQLRKWVNGGAFDGGQLNFEEAALRAEYAAILKTAQAQEALRSGALYDLDWYNRGREGYSRWNYAFLRVGRTQSLLAVFHFDTVPAETTILLPEGAWERLGWEPGSSLSLKDVQNSVEFPAVGGIIVLPMSAHGYRLLEIRRN